MKKAILLVAVVGSFALAFSLVWMNRYSYRQKGVQIVRVNRFTSQLCYSQNDGTWNSNVEAPSKGLAKYMLDPAKWDAEVAGKEITFSLPPGIPPPPPGFVMDMKTAAEGYALNTCR